MQSGCTTNPVWGVKNVGTGSFIATVPIANGAVTVDSGVLSVSMPVSSRFVLGVSTAGVGCAAGVYGMALWNGRNLPVSEPLC